MDPNDTAGGYQPILLIIKFIIKLRCELLRTSSVQYCLNYMDTYFSISPLRGIEKKDVNIATDFLIAQRSVRGSSTPKSTEK